jgi:plastocyanin
VTDLERRRLVLSGAAAAITAAVPAFSVRSAVSGPVNHAVIIRAFRFEPEVLEIRPGDTVTWTNEDLVPHTATAADRSWDTGRIDRAASVSLVFPEAAKASDYFCRFHPAMKARISAVAGA